MGKHKGANVGAAGNKPLWPIMAVALGVAMPPMAAAQDASGESQVGVEEIFVTARKREENLQDVPIAVTAFGEQQIEDARLDRIEDFVALTPNVNLRATNSRTSSQDIVIRGVASDTSQEPGYGFYQDDVYVGGIAQTFGNFNDLERVEILRGPQGALYGRNAVGGAINVVTRRPEFNDVALRVEGTAARYDRSELRFSANAPLVEDTLAVRIGGFLIEQNEGEYYNMTLGEEFDAESSAGLRGRVRWAPTSDLDLLFSAEVVDEVSGPTPRLDVAGGETARTLQYNTPNRNTLYGEQYTQRTDWTLPFATLTGIFSYRSEEATALADFDQTATASLVLDQSIDRDNVYDEVRLVSSGDGPFNWIIGASYYGEDRVSLLNTDVDLGLGFLGAGFASLQTFANADLETESQAFFAEIGYRFGSFDATASVRYTEDEKTLNYQQGIPELIGLPGPFAVFGLPPFQLTIAQTQTFENVSPGVSLTYRATEDVQFYGKVGAGFRAGGFNTVVSNPAFLPYDEETSVNYELGLKSELFDNRVRFNAAVFRLDQSDLIVDVNDPNPLFASIGQTYNTNAGEAETYGFEADVMTRLMDGLDVGVAVGLISAELTEFTTAAGVDASGNQPPGTPEGTVGLLATYRWPVGSSLNGFAGANANWSWGGYQDVENLIALDDRNVIDLSLGLESDHWRLVAFADNVTDEQYILNRNLTNTSVAYAPGSTYGVQVAVNW